MDTVEKEILSSLRKAMDDCNDNRAEEMWSQLHTYRNEMRGK